MTNILVAISRSDAAERGLKKYYTGQPCKHGHVTFRYTQSGACADCLAASQNRYKPKSGGVDPFPSERARVKAHRDSMSLVEIKVRVYTDEIDKVRQMALLFTQGRYPHATPSDITPPDKISGTDHGSGLALFVLRLHADDAPTIHAFAETLRKSRYVDIEAVARQANAYAMRAANEGVRPPPEWKP